MPSIKPVSDLRNYNEVLLECENGNPVFLTKNGRGKYVIIDIKEYEKQQAMLKLLSKLNPISEYSPLTTCCPKLLTTLVSPYRYFLL